MEYTLGVIIGKESVWHVKAEMELEPPFHYAAFPDTIKGRLLELTQEELRRLKGEAVSVSGRRYRFGEVEEAAGTCVLLKDWSDPPKQDP